jgi:hypothetical protein
MHPSVAAGDTGEIERPTCGYDVHALDVQPQLVFVVGLTPKGPKVIGILAVDEVHPPQYLAHLVSF